MSRIVLVAATLTGNQGAEAMLSATIGRLAEARPDARFTVLSYYPKTDRALGRPGIEVLSATPLALVMRHVPGALFARALPRRMRASARLLPTEVRRIAEADVLVDLAGVSFIDGREKYLPFNILSILAALMLGTPVVKLSQAIGPCQRRLTRLAARVVLHRCTRIFARGQRTFAHLKKLGLRNIEPAPDVAFLLRHTDRLAARPPEEAEVPKAWLAEERQAKRSIVGICPSALVYEQLGSDYAAFVAHIARRLLSRGISVLLFPNATRQDTAKTRNNDLAALAAVQNALSEGGYDTIWSCTKGGGERGRLFFLKRRTDAVELKTLIADLDLAVVSRFHAMVGALSTATPTVVLGWGHKYREVMAEFDMEDFVLDAGDAVRKGVDAFETLAVNALANREQLRWAIGNRLPEVERAATLQIAHVIDLLPATSRPDHTGETVSERTSSGCSVPASAA